MLRHERLQVNARPQCNLLGNENKTASQYGLWTACAGPAGMSGNVQPSNITALLPLFALQLHAARASQPADKWCLRRQQARPPSVSHLCFRLRPHRHQVEVGVGECGEQHSRQLRLQGMRVRHNLCRFAALKQK